MHFASQSSWVFWKEWNDIDIDIDIFHSQFCHRAIGFSISEHCQSIPPADCFLFGFDESIGVFNGEYLVVT